jgi:uncharacterized protein YceK
MTRTVKRGALALLLGLFVGSGSGCASTVGLIFAPNEPYAGTRLDAALVKDGEIYAVLDMPASLILDTVTLPITLTGIAGKGARFM